MANTALAKSSAYYPTFLTNSEFATKFVANLTEATPLAPAAQTLATDYITGLLNSGQSRGQVFLAVSTFLTNPATLTDAQFGALAQQFQNEVAVATYYTVDKNGASLDPVTLQQVLDGVTNDANSVTAAKAVIDTGKFFDGKTITLTTGQDTFLGTVGQDTINGVVSSNDADHTFQSFDKIDGGAGIDILSLVVEDDRVVTPDVKNVETISIRVLDSSTASLDFSNVSGVQTLEMHDIPIGQYASIDAWNIQEWIPTLSFHNVADQNYVSMDLTYHGTVGQGDNDTVKVIMDNAGSDSDSDGFADEMVYLDINTDSGDSAVEHMNINSTGSNGFNALYVYSATHLEDVTITGNADMYLSVSSADVLANVDATALKGALRLYMNASSNDVTVTTNLTGAYDDWVSYSGSGNATVSTGAGNDSITTDSGDDVINAGDGNDYVWMGTGKDTVDAGAGDDNVEAAGNLSAGDSFDGGAGRDTITVSTALAGSGIPVDANKVATATVKNFEILGVSDTLANDIDLAKWQGGNTIDSVTLNSGFGTFKIDGLGANSTVTTKADSTGQTLTANLKDASGTSDVMNIVVKNGGTINAGTIAAANVETVNVTFDDTSTSSKDTATLALTDAAAKTINVNGDYNAAAMTVTDLSVLTTFNAGTFAGGVTIDFTGHAKSLTVTGGAGADNFNLGAKGGNTVTTGAGADTVTVGAGSGNTIDLGSGNDTLNLGNTINNTITLGSGTDTVNLTGVPTNGQSYSTITDFAKGDLIDLTGVTDLTAFAATKVSLAATAVFQDYLDAVVAGAAVGGAGWFQWNGDTYVVQDVGGDSATFTNAEDFVIKLTGAIDLSKAAIDLVNDTITGG